MLLLSSIAQFSHPTVQGSISELLWVPIIVDKGRQCLVLFGPGFDKIVILGIISIPYNFRSCLFYYLALLALSEIASVRLCGLLFWYTGGFPARTTFDFLAAAPPLPNVCNWCWIVWGLQFIKWGWKLSKKIKSIWPDTCLNEDYSMIGTWMVWRSWMTSRCLTWCTMHTMQVGITVKEVMKEEFARLKWI